MGKKSNKSGNIFDDPREPDFNVEFKTEIKQPKVKLEESFTKPLEEIKEDDNEEANEEAKKDKNKNNILGNVLSAQQKKYRDMMRDQLSVVDPDILNF